MRELDPLEDGFDGLTGDVREGHRGDSTGPRRGGPGALVRATALPSRGLLPTRSAILIRAGPGLLDVDTACLGERALDLGNLRAHARWRTEQGLWTPAEAAAVINEIARVASVAGIEPGRVSVFERATLIRLACVYAFRPRWSDRIGWLLETARSLRG